MKKCTITKDNLPEITQQLEDFLLNFNKCYYGEAITSSKFSRKLVKNRYAEEIFGNIKPAVFVYEMKNKIFIDIFLKTTDKSSIRFITLNVGDSFYTDWKKKIYFKTAKETTHCGVYLGK